MAATLCRTRKSSNH